MLRDPGVAIAGAGGQASVAIAGAGGGQASAGDSLGVDVVEPSQPPVGMSGDGSTEEASAPEQGVAAGSRVRRLQREDMDRVVSDLLRLDASVADALPEDVPTLHGYLEDDKLRISERYNTELTLAAESLAQAVRNNSASYDALTQCFGSFDSACRDSYLSNFVSRAYRRPATPSELSAYTELFERGKDVVQSGDDFADGVQVVVEAVLQSPKFLYRIEQGAGVEDKLGTPLTDHEVASRLSFMLWGTIPDDELRAAADAGQLSTPEQIAEQARRMAESPRVNDKLVDFHERWMQVNALSGVSKDRDIFAPFSLELVNAMREELRLFVTEITLNSAGGVSELLTAPFGYSNSVLDSVYASGAGDGELKRVDYGADSPRAGILTQAAFLTGHSSSSATTSPILRGIFVLDRLLCYEMPPPPANAASTEPPPPDIPPVTTRDMFAWKTSMAECAGCHELINPLGFAFESFDAIGRYRTTENGAAVDTTGAARVPQAFEFTNAKELVEQLASLEATQACYSRHLMEYSYARPSVATDKAMLASLTDAFVAGSFGARKALVALASDAAFTHLPE